MVLSDNKDVITSKNDFMLNRAGIVSDMLLYVLFFFPLSSLLKTKISALNLVLTAMCVCLFFIYYFFSRFDLERFFIALYIGGTILLNISIWGFKYYENNMLFYFPFLLLFYEFVKRESGHIRVFVEKHGRYIDSILAIWNVAVFVSFFLSSSYIYEGETRGFVSFAGTTFLLCPISVLVFAMTLIRYKFQPKCAYLFSLLICSLCILLGSSRTYLAVLLCAWLIFIYINMNNKRVFPSIVILGVCLFAVVVLFSPISEKFINTASRSTSIGIDPLEAFTSGRSVFWAYDVHQIFKSKVFNLLFGHGVNWLFYLNFAFFGNPLWAHNDFIQLLSDYGLVGLSIYLWSILSLVKSALSKTNCSFLIIGIASFMWLFNAFFNMFYTYFCAAISLPFFLLVLLWDSESRVPEEGCSTWSDDLIDFNEE